tara:strand:+ start:189 stop:437 length:249 start_codon:yes stop_codon:yes gene_type:complete
MTRQRGGQITVAAAACCVFLEALHVFLGPCDLWLAVRKVMLDYLNLKAYDRISLLIHISKPLSAAPHFKKPEQETRNNYPRN